MNIGLVVYSWSGHTQEVAEKLRDALTAKSHGATLIPITLTEERKQGAREFEIAEMPDLSGYDAVVFGAAVEAFSLSPVLSEYLKRVESLSGKKAACLVSQQFPYAWMGGNRAIRQMKRLAKAKGAAVAGAAVVHWTASRRDSSIAAAVEKLAQAF
jgi:menaquinone-dependent protoporphyrinogen IX oxidase